MTTAILIIGAVWSAPAILLMQTAMGYVTIIRPIAAEALGAAAAGIMSIPTETAAVIIMCPDIIAAEAAALADMETVFRADAADSKRNHYAERTGDNQSY